MITRPAHQAGPITEKLKAAGANTFLFPTLEIAPADPDTKSQRQFHQFDIIIFISSNAIEYGLSHIQTLPPLPDTLQFATIGKASANTFKNIFGKQADIVPTENFNSEGLLATEAMQKVANKHILIIRGNGGREYLKNALEKRGAHVEYFTAYQRLKPNTNT